MKSFTQEYPISVVASTQRIVHSPKKHTFGSVIYSAKEDCYYEEEPYRNIEVVDRIGSGDAYVSGALYGLLAYDFDCQKALEYGNAAGAVKNTIKGDLPSCSKREMDAIIRNHKHVGPELKWTDKKQDRHSFIWRMPVLFFVNTNVDVCSLQHEKKTAYFMKISKLTEK